MIPYVDALIGLVMGFILAQTFARLPANLGHDDASRNAGVTASLLVATNVLLGGILGVLLFLAVR